MAFMNESINTSQIKKKQQLSPLYLKAIGVLLAIIMWQILAGSSLLGDKFGPSFAPVNTFLALWDLIVSGELLKHCIPSLRRVFIGLGTATILGIIIGVLTGVNKYFAHLSYVPFQLIRMISPLAWMPIAIIVLGIGDKPVYCLIILSAIWPIIMNTSLGIEYVSSQWVEVVKTLGGSNWAVLWKVIVPAIIPYILAGLKLAVGISWIILVPAEMLGVDSGLGYFILDCRDRFSYGEMMAVILVIGLIGLILDWLLELMQKKVNWEH